MDEDKDRKAEDKNRLVDPGAPVRVLKFLTEAKAPWETDGLGVRGNAPSSRGSAGADQPESQISRTPRQEIFPPEDPPAPQTVAAGLALNASFLLRKGSSTGNPPVKKVKIMDGKINGEFPAGMGGNNYELIVTGDKIIYAGVTFNTETLALTSRFLDAKAAAAFPISRIEGAVGYLYFQIGFTFETGTPPRMKSTLWQTWLGDINFELVYGSVNGVAAIIPVMIMTKWLAVPLPPFP